MSTATDESRGTAFRTAFLMGDKGKALFLWLAGQDDADARRAAARSLYLHWRHEPEYVFGLMNDLANRVTLPPIGRSGRVLRFLAELSVTIYVNHPEQKEVLQRTAALWTDVLTRRLRLRNLVFLWPLFGSGLANSVAQRTLSTALLSELQPDTLFFSQSEVDRRRFLRTAVLVDPDEPLRSGEVDDLVELLRSEVLLHRILAAVVLAIHGVRDPAATAALLKEMEGRIDGEAALWALLGFSVPLPTTPTAWTPLLERMTERLILKDRSAFSDDSGVLAGFDIALLPLGLAYGKQGLTMPLIDKLLTSSLEHDRPLALRIVRGLAAVGFYYPNAVFSTLRRHPTLFQAEDAAGSLASTLAAMRALHFDRVDLFLGEMGAPPALREKIAREPESSLVLRCMNWIGFFNNAVHEALYYPAMRRALLLGGLTHLGQAAGPADFLKSYADDLIALAKRADFQLIRWTDPSFESAAGAAEATR
jgi:hypothetical protein